jgi:hypothetical protein
VSGTKQKVTNGKDIPSAPWEREVKRMDDKKNVNFVSGLALLLAILALVMVAWSGIGGDITPYQTEYKNYIEGKFGSLDTRVNELTDTLGDLKEATGNGHLDWQVYKLQELSAAVGALSAHSAPEFKAELNALHGQIVKMSNKVKGLKDQTQAKKNKGKAKPAEKKEK